MKLILKSKLFSWHGAYNVYDTDGNVKYIVKGKPAFGKKFVVFDNNKNELAKLKEKIFAFVPTFKVHKEGRMVGKIRKTGKLVRPKFKCSFGGYEIVGNVWETQYDVQKNNKVVATIDKSMFALKSEWHIDVQDDCAVDVLLIALAVDANKEKNDNNFNQFDAWGKDTW